MRHLHHRGEVIAEGYVGGRNRRVYACSEPTCGWTTEA